jgi:hypothetical protein
MNNSKCKLGPEPSAGGGWRRINALIGVAEAPVVCGKGGSEGRIRTVTDDKTQ